MYFEKILNLVFPPTCGFCNCICSDFLCETCKEHLKNHELCAIQSYKNEIFLFDEHFYLFNYSSEIREKILQYKFHEKSYLYKSFAKLFVESVEFQQFIKNYTCIVPVPLHKARLKSRGYNQSELVAKEIAKSCNIKLCTNLLIKEKNIIAQSSLDKYARQENIKGAFSVNLNAIAPNNKYSFDKILIFDDIFTTGATANECAKTILKVLSPSKIRHYYNCQGYIKCFLLMINPIFKPRISFLCIHISNHEFYNICIPNNYKQLLCPGHSSIQ